MILDVVENIKMSSSNGLRFDVENILVFNKNHANEPNFGCTFKIDEFIRLITEGAFWG